MFLRFAELIAALILLLTFVTQVLIPAWQGRALFPIFRRQARLERTLARLRQQELEADLEDEIERHRRTLGPISKSNHEGIHDEQ